MRAYLPVRPRSLLLTAISLLTALPSFAAAPIVYDVDLSRRDHHEMTVEVRFEEVTAEPLEVRMSRTSPGRYALHEFAKNAYSVSAVDGRGRALEISRPDLHQWNVNGHDGTVVFRYTLFGDRSDGTYAAIDSSHAHLNVPASFVWARGLEDRPVEVCIETPEGWEVSTQLMTGEDGCRTAPDLAYFVDSPIEVSAAERFAWTVGEGEGEQTVELVLHHTGDSEEANVLADVTKVVVDEQIALFGEAPSFDDGRYTFLVDALPWSNGDGMEHRNSTIVATGGTVKDRIDGLVGTISHEFFHAWNVERIRPGSLEPFDLEAANVSRELWFAEGFTSYYGNLVLARIGVDDLEDFAATLGFYVSRVVNSPGRDLRSAAEMSSRAPFVDAARANEPTNRANTFISYYTYGAALGLGLDLTLRTSFDDLTLDDVMRAAWAKFGATEISYENDDLRRLLGEVSGDPGMADAFFERSVFGTEPPDFESLLAAVGLRLRPRDPEDVWLGAARLTFEEGDEEDDEKGGARVEGSPRVGSPLYQAGVGRNDLLISLDDVGLTSEKSLEEALEAYAPGDEVELVFEKRGEEHTVAVTLAENPRLEVVTFEAAGEEITAEVRSRRDAWLAPLAEPRLELLRYCPRTGQPRPYSVRYCPVHGDELKLGPGKEEE